MPIDRLVFSELTFASAAARIPFTPVEANVRMGDRIDLGQAPRILEHGRKLAAELGWPELGRARKVSSGPS